MLKSLGAKMAIKPTQNHFTYCLTIVLVCIIIAYTQYKLKDRELMAKNIETAMSKDINPVAVRCSYASNDDVICVTYALSPSTKK
jgi:hypothetical protein